MQPCRTETGEAAKLPVDQQIKPDAHGMSTAGHEMILVTHDLYIHGKICVLAADTQRKVWGRVERV
jgi:hypothetical protein